MHDHPTPRHRDERGMATAELAVITPLAVAFAVLLIWAVSLGYTQVRLTDAAREAARLVARGESVQVAEQVALAQSPEGTSVDVVRDGATVVVTVEVRSGLPGGWFGEALSRDLAASAVAALESP